VHIPDANEDADLAAGAAGIARSFLSVPMMREGVPIGAIGVARVTPGPFAPEEIALVKTFADQAVIAIENVRLFTELQEKNQALTAAHARVTEALDHVRDSCPPRQPSRRSTPVAPGDDQGVRGWEAGTSTASTDLPPTRSRRTMPAS